MRFKNRNTRIVLTLVLGLAFVVALGCDSDNGTSSEFATVSGKITFENVAMWPDSGEVQVTIWAKDVWTTFGPVGPPFGQPIVLQKVQGQTEYDYKFEGLSPGEYSAIAVGWRRPNAQNFPAEQRTATLGVYWNNPDSVSVGLNIPGTPFQAPAPAVLTLAKGDDVTNLDLKADYLFVQFLFGQP